MDESTPTEPEETPVPIPADAAKIAKLRREARKWRRMSRFGSCISSLGISGAMFGPMLFNVHSFGSIIIFVISGMTVNISGAWIELGARHKRSKAIEQLTKSADISIIGLIIDELDLKITSDAVPMALTALLPRLQATDAPLITSSRHRILNGALTRRMWLKDKTHADLLCAILKAYEQVGNADDLPTVERLANGEGYAKKDKRIQEAAQACLPYLQARSEQQEARQTLLRASSETADNGTNLLRPSYGGNGTEPSQLLRASNAETAD